MDGRFPNHHPDPTLPEAMKDLIGQGPGDGGRPRHRPTTATPTAIGVVDDTGNIIWGDQLMVVFARDILPAHPGAAIISEVKASKVLYDEIARLGRPADHVENGPFPASRRRSRRRRPSSPGR